jgi:hypothetical protein
MREINFENPEKNNENQEKIAMIESLKTGFEQKAGLVLVLLGEKPALSLTVFTDTPEEARTEEEKINNIGLRSRKISQQEKNGKYVIKFLIAGNENNLNALAEIDPSVDHTKFGALMGYPSTAIKAFSEGELMNIDEERELLDKYPEIVFHNFRLSKDGQEEEIKTLKRWNDIIKKAAPNIYPRTD